MFEIEESGKSTIIFMNRGTDIINHNFEMNEVVENPELLRETLYDEDKVKFNDAMKAAYATKSKISFQYRIVINGQVRWRWMQAMPEQDPTGKYIWYGSTSDITPIVDYIGTIEQILFDISHVMRRPITTIVGLTNMIGDATVKTEEIKTYAELLKAVCIELAKFTTELNEDYNKRRQNPQFTIDLSSQLDKREFLFK